MQIIITTLASAFLAGPGASMAASVLPDLSAINPFECVSLSSQGVGLEYGANGLTPSVSGGSELSMTLSLKSGAMIRVTF